MTTILVIGATGNIGSATVEYLLKKPEIKIIVGTQNIKAAQEKFIAAPQIEFRAFDFLDNTTFQGALVDIDKVFFIRPPQLSKPKEDMLPFLTAVKQQMVQQIVFISLLGVENNPMTPHHKIEKMMCDLEIPFTFIRPSFFMQNLSTTHREDIQKHDDIFVPAGKAKTSFIDTKDVGEVAGRCLIDDVYIGKKLDITGAEALTYYEVATIMSEELGRPIKYSKPGLLHFRKVMIKRGTPKAYANVMTMLYLITQLGNAKTITNTVEDVLGKPPTTFRDFVKNHRDSFQKN